MTTNNHPANGPVSLDRLHQISEILSKAAAQSDGGNLGYAMADAVKVIDGAIAAFGAEPVAWTEKCEITNMQATGLYLRGFPDNSQGRDIALYTSPPAVLDDESIFEAAIEECKKCDSIDEHAWNHGVLAVMSKYDACRAAILQGEPQNAQQNIPKNIPAGNSPATPDGYVLVPIEPTMAMLDEFDSIIDHGAEDSKDAWSRLIAAAPQQDVNRG